MQNLLSGGLEEMAREKDWDRNRVSSWISFSFFFLFFHFCIRFLVPLSSFSLPSLPFSKFDSTLVQHPHSFVL